MNAGISHTPASSTAAATASHSSTDSDSGFSIRMCFPARAASMASGACESWWVQMYTAPRSGSASRRGMSVVAYPPCSAASRLAAAGTTSAKAVKRAPPTSRTQSACTAPRLPQPIRPKRKSGALISEDPGR